MTDWLMHLQQEPNGHNIKCSENVAQYSDLVYNVLILISSYCTYHKNTSLVAPTPKSGHSSIMKL